MNQIIASAIMTVSLVISAFGQVERNPIKVSGEVVAYVKSNIEVKSGSVNGETLLARVKFSRSTKTDYIWLLHEYIGNESNLPAKVFNSGRKWKLEINRRVDCDSVLRPDYSDLGKDFLKTTSSNEKWVMDDPPEINFIITEKSLNIPADKVLPCYEILSLK
jgi:hypothetical protein